MAETPKLVIVNTADGVCTSEPDRTTGLFPTLALTLPRPRASQPSLISTFPLPIRLPGRAGPGRAWQGSNTSMILKIDSLLNVVSFDATRPHVSADCKRMILQSPSFSLT